MREIKFRAWFKGEKYPFDEHNIEDYEKPRMIYDVQNAYDGRGIKDEHNGFGYISCFSDFFDEDDFIVMQYTGLKDKSGKEIYEGDIVDTLDGLGRVIYDNNLCTFSIEYDISIIAFMHYVTQEKATLEVIGNIYEHSHLLEGE